MFLGCFDYDRMMCWRHMIVRCFDDKQVVVGGMGYALGFVVVVCHLFIVSLSARGSVILSGRGLCVSYLVILLGVER